MLVFPLRLVVPLRVMGPVRLKGPLRLVVPVRLKGPLITVGPSTTRFEENQTDFDACRFPRMVTLDENTLALDATMRPNIVTSEKKAALSVTFKFELIDTDPLKSELDEKVEEETDKSSMSTLDKRHGPST